MLRAGLAWALMILSMVCWGSWANTFKLTKGVRFELFYWDYAVGLALSSMVLAAVLDVPNGYGNAFPASLLDASRTALWQAAAAGVVFICCWSRRSTWRDWRSPFRLRSARP